MAASPAQAAARPLGLRARGSGPVQSSPVSAPPPRRRNRPRPRRTRAPARRTAAPRRKPAARRRAPTRPVCPRSHPRPGPGPGPTAPGASGREPPRTRPAGPRTHVRRRPPAAAPAGPRSRRSARPPAPGSPDPGRPRSRSGCPPPGPPSPRWPGRPPRPRRGPASASRRRSRRTRRSWATSRADKLASRPARSVIDEDATTSSQSCVDHARALRRRGLEQHRGGRTGQQHPVARACTSPATAPPLCSPGPLHLVRPRWTPRAHTRTAPRVDPAAWPDRSATFFPGPRRDAKEHAARIIRQCPRKRNTGSSPRAGTPPTRRTTIADVAREAGVNKGTVSRALRGIPGVGPSTRQRIIADRRPAGLLGLARWPAPWPAAVRGRSGIVLPTLRSWYFSEFASGPARS